MLRKRVGEKQVEKEMCVLFRSVGLQDKKVRLFCATLVLGIEEITAIYLVVYLAYCIFCALLHEKIKLEKA